VKSGESLLRVIYPLSVTPVDLPPQAQKHGGKLDVFERAPETPSVAVFVPVCVPGSDLRPETSHSLGLSRLALGRGQFVKHSGVVED
jgi:hypothetical protein